MMMTKHKGAKAAALALAVVLVAVMGCLGSPSPASTPALSVKAVDGNLKAVPGTNVTFMLKVRSSQKVLDNVSLTVAAQPALWSTALSASTMDLAPGASKGVMLVVSIPPGETAAERTIKVKAASNLRSFSATCTVKATVKQSYGGPLDLVRSGNLIKVDYTGYLADHLVFDSSVRAIGSDQAFAKSSSFKSPSDNTYQPLAFTVNSDQMIKGFDTAVVGMGAGQSKTIRVPPAQGYGKFGTMRVNLTETFPMRLTMPRLNFTITYGEDAMANKVVTEPYWGWKVQVLSVDNENASLMILPEINSTLFPYGWETKVVDVNGSADGGIGRITVRHYPGTGGNLTVRGMKAEIVELTTTYADLSYNLVTGNELATQDLYFSIRVVSIS
jgi:FKBP-type peptidyl-prolyl cis-trans isomerase 2